MWPGCGGRFYWAPGSAAAGQARGVAVVFAWVWSDEAQLLPFVKLYASLGWHLLLEYQWIRLVESMLFRRSSAASARAAPLHADRTLVPLSSAPHRLPARAQLVGLWPAQEGA